MYFVHPDCMITQFFWYIRIFCVISSMTKSPLWLWSHEIILNSNLTKDRAQIVCDLWIVINLSVFPLIVFVESHWIQILYFVTFQLSASNLLDGFIKQSYACMDLIHLDSEKHPKQVILLQLSLQKPIKYAVT